MILGGHVLQQNGICLTFKGSLKLFFWGIPGGPGIILEGNIGSSDDWVWSWRSSFFEKQQVLKNYVSFGFWVISRVFHGFSGSFRMVCERKSDPESLWAEGQGQGRPCSFRKEKSSDVYIEKLMFSWL